ncbi:MAG: hypothetical protein ACP5VS_14185 [Desulfomonilaceae bacterium]
MGGDAAKAVTQKLVVSTQRAWVTLTRHRKMDALIDKFRARNGPKSVMKPKCHKTFVLQAWVFIQKGVDRRHGRADTQDVR